MRLIVVAAALVFALTLAGAVQAGEGCPHAKAKAEAAEAGPACSHACPHAAASAAGGGCGCAAAAAEATAGDQAAGETEDEAPVPSDPGEDVAAND